MKKHAYEKNPPNTIKDEQTAGKNMFILMHHLEYPRTITLLFNSPA
jgi:hypothetical protein